MVGGFLNEGLLDHASQPISRTIKSDIVHLDEDILDLVEAGWKSTSREVLQVGIQMHGDVDSLSASAASWTSHLLVIRFQALVLASRA